MTQIDIKQNERLNSFKKVVLGTYVLKELKNKKKNGCMYVNSISNWEAIKDKNIYFNIFDKNNDNPFKNLREVIIENFLKTNYIIIRLESNSSSLSFYCNNLPNVYDPNFSIIKLLVNPYDYISSEGDPTYNESYTLSYILNDPSKEYDIVNTSTTNNPSNSSHIFSLETPITLPESNFEEPRKYADVPNTPLGTAAVDINLKKIIPSIAEVKEEIIPKIKVKLPLISRGTIELFIFLIFIILLIGSKYI